MAASDDLLNQWKKEQELTAAPAAGTTTNSTGSDALLNSWKNDLESNITVSVQNAAKGNPERAAEVQKVARALLVPTDVVDKNWDNLSAFAKTRQFQMQRNAAEDPILAHMYANPDFAAVAVDDYPNVSQAGAAIRNLGKQPERTFTGTLQDIGVTAGKGIIGTGEAAVGLADIVTKGWVGKQMEDYLGYDPDASKKFLETFYSDAQKYANQNVAEAKGILPKLEAALSNPSVIATTVGESIPLMLGGGVIGRGLGALRGLAGNAITRSAIGEGVVSAGSIAEQTRQGEGIPNITIFGETREPGRLTTEQALASVVGGAATSLIAQVGAKAAQRLGITDIDVLITGGNTYNPALNKSLGRQIIEGGIVEGFFQEMPQSGVEQLVSNYAQGKPIFEGMDDALVMGTLAGIAMGGGGPVVAYPANVRADREAARNAEQKAMLMDMFAQHAEASNLLKRDPESFQQYIEQVTEDGDVQHVYIKASVLQQLGMAEQVAAAIPAVAEQLQQAVSPEQEIQIPVAEYATKIAPTEANAVLLDNLRVEGETMTRAEANAFIESESETLQKAYEKAQNTKLSFDEFKKSAKAVESDLASQFNQVGLFTPADNKVQAALYSRVFSMLALRLNQTPQQVYDKFKTTIAAEGSLTTALGTDHFSQENGVQKSEMGTNKLSDQAEYDKALAGFTDYYGDRTKAERLLGDYISSVNSLVNNGGKIYRVVFADSPKQIEVENFGRHWVADSGDLGMIGDNLRNYFGQGANAYIIEATVPAGVVTNANVDIAANPEEREVGMVSNPQGVSYKIYEADDQYQPAKTIADFSADVLNQRGVQRPGKPVPESVDAVSNVAAAFNHAAGQTFKTNRDFKLDIQNRVLEAAKAAKVDLSEFTQGVEEYLVRVALADSMTALETNPNAVGWYNEKVTKALRLVSLIHPEIATDSQAKFAFTWALAVTSNGLKVDKNFELAERAYSYYKQNGKMPTDMDAGKAQIAINAGLDLFNELIEKHGFETVEKFMTTRQTVKEVEAFTGRNVSGENLTTEVYGAAALGPKIGNGFFANLYGHFEQLTMDRWLMRTWGRWTGTLVEENKANVKLKRSQLKSLIQAMTPQQRKTFEKIIKQKLLVGKSDSLDAVAKAINKASTAPANRVAMAQVGKESADMQAVFEEILGPLKKNQVRASIGDELRKVGNSLTGYLDGQKEAPSGPPERARIRKVMAQVLEQMQAQYPALTMSDLQALLWYPEKRLYDAAKTAEEGETSYEDDEAPDYANAAAALAKELGVSQDLIDQTIAEVDDELQAAERARRAGRGAGDGILGQGAQQGVLNQAGRAEEVSLTEEEKALAEDIKSNGGVTLDKNGNAAVIDSGYVVAIRSQNVVGAESAVRALRDFVKENEVLLNRENVVVGVFKFDDGSNRFSIDLNVVIPDRDAAVQIGTALDQIAIWDAANSTVIETGGKGGLGLDIAVADSLLSAIDNGEYNVRLEELQARSQVNGGAVGQVQSAGSNGASIASDRRSDQAVGGRSYGTATEGSVARLGYHFSREPRTTLDGRAHGTGLTAQERVRLAQADDARIKERIYFYVDNGNGIKPESGVGANAHSVNLNNLYDIKADPLGLRAAAAANGTDPDGVWFNAVESAIIDAGFDGYVSDTAQTNQGVAVLLGRHAVEVDQIQAPGFTQPAPRTQARGTPVFTKYLNQNAIFYSALQRAFESVKQGSMPADQWIKWLSSNQPKLGVKKEEIEATGLREYLELNGKDKLTKEQIVEFLQNNGVRVEEVMYGDMDAFSRRIENQLEQDGTSQGFTIEPNGDRYDLIDRWGDLVRTVEFVYEAADIIANRVSDTDTKYEQYQLPGGTKYKELIFTLPTAMGAYNKFTDDLRAKYGKGGFDSLPLTDEERYTLDKLMEQGEDEPYQHPHWKETNVLAHIRFNERTDTDGKRVLFIEEIQSDWAQEGRKQGFGVEKPSQIRQLENGDYVVTGTNGQEVNIGPHANPEMVAQGLGISSKPSTIPDAPFVKKTEAWVGLAIKRMIRYAADNKIDKVAFVSGEQSHKRFPQKNNGESSLPGFKKFYDEIVPQVANDVLKKLGGGKVETIKVNSFELDENMDEVQTTPEQLGFTITPAMRDAVLAGQALFQKNRGYIDPKNLIAILTPDADRSTPGHELAHAVVEIYTRIANAEGAPAEIVSDLDQLLVFAGVQGADQKERLANWSAMTLDEQRPFHEAIAYNWEIYLAEGKAPSVELQSVFDRLSQWIRDLYVAVRDHLNGIYKAEFGKDLPIMTEGVREVFDRMLASQDQIAQAESVRNMQVLFESKPEGMDDAQWAALQQLAAEARDMSISKLTTDSLRQMRWLSNAKMRVIKQMQREALAIRVDVEREVEAEIKKSPVYKAVSYIVDGVEVLTDGTTREATGPHKISIAGLEDLYMGDGDRYALLDWSQLPRKMYGAEGMHPDALAELLGFQSGDQLVRTLIEAPSLKEAVRKATDARMLAEYGEMNTQREIDLAVERALHNEARARFVAAELRFVSRATAPARAMIQAAKRAAQNIINTKLIKDLKPSEYGIAEARANKEAMTAQKKGDDKAVLSAMQSALLNNQLAAVAADTRSQIDKGLVYLRKVTSDANRKRIGADAGDQIDALLSRFDLSAPGSTVRSMSEWVAKVTEAGFDPSISPDMLNDNFRKPFKMMSVKEFNDLMDAVRQIEHLGRNEQMMLTAAKDTAYKEARDQMVESINANANGRTADVRTAKTKLGKMAQGLHRFFAEHIKAATIARILDGGKEGPVWEYLIRPANAAADRETAMRAEATRDITEILAPVLKSKMGGKGVLVPSIGRALNKEERIAVALNMGNDGNIQRLLSGENWTIEQVTPILESLTAAELEAVQKIWDYSEQKHKPLIAEQWRRLYGREPEWVEPRPMTVKSSDGQVVNLRGGYYPIVYDPRASQRAGELYDAEQARMEMQGFISATISTSFAKSRVQMVKDRPLLLSLAGVYNGVNDVIHALSWQEYIIDANRLLRSFSIDQAIRTRYGPEFKQQLKAWVKDVAVGERAAQEGGAQAINFVRQSVSAAGLGFNIMSALQQVTGFSSSIVKIGARYVGRGITKTMANPAAAIKMVYEKSTFMANRGRTQFRELNELRNMVQGETAVARGVKTGTYFMMAQMQRMVDIPTWIGAYEKAIGEGNDEARAIALADQSVIDSQGGGMLKDLSKIERGGPWLKLFTVFYSYMGTQFNLVTAEAMTERSKGKLAAKMLMLTIVPVVLAYAIKHGLTPDDEDEWDWEKIAKELISENLAYLMGMMIIVRELGAAAKVVVGAEGGNRGYGGPAGTRMISDLYTFATQAKQGDFDDAFRKAAINLLGDFTGLPSAQINRTINGVDALIEGKTSNPAAVLTGFEKR